MACMALLTFFSVRAAAQNYKTGLGARLEIGDGGTGVGFNAKHFLSKKYAVDANVIFYDGGTVGVGAEYQFQSPISGVEGLDWYAGLGPNFLFGKYATAVQIRPVGGLDYKFAGAPINVAFDWRPAFTLTQGTDFTAARFGISLRYTL